MSQKTPRIATFDVAPFQVTADIAWAEPGQPIKDAVVTIMCGGYVYGMPTWRARALGEALMSAASIARSM